MLKHIGADNPVEPALGQIGKKLIRRVVANHLANAPEIGNAGKFSSVGQFNRHLPVLVPFARTVIENGGRTDDVYDVLDSFKRL